jgi:hypothetical protein
MREIEKRILEFVSLATPANTNTACCCNVHAARSEKIDALLAQLTAVKQVGKTDHEAPVAPPRRLVIKPSPAWRKMVTLG